MYILIEYSSNYLERTRNLWIDSKDWGTNFNVDNANDKNFKSFKYKVKLLGNTVAQAAPNQDYGNLKKATAVPLKYLNNFCRSLEMPLINCKLELKLK